MRSMICTASTGYFPAAGFGGQHDRVRAVIDRRSNIGRFRARGARRFDHRFQHLRRDDDRLSSVIAPDARFFSRLASSEGISTPRSPRASMMPSQCCKISVKYSSADGFSIFAINAAAIDDFFVSATSAAVCTKDCATQCPFLPAARSIRSSRSARA